MRSSILGTLIIGQIPNSFASFSRSKRNQVYTPSQPDLFCKVITGDESSQCYEYHNIGVVNWRCQSINILEYEQPDCRFKTLKKYADILSDIVGGMARKEVSYFFPGLTGGVFGNLLKVPMGGTFSANCDKCEADLLRKLITLYSTVPTFAQRFSVHVDNWTKTSEELTKEFVKNGRDASSNPAEFSLDALYANLRKLAKGVLNSEEEVDTNILLYLAVILSGPNVPVHFLAAEDDPPPTPEDLFCMEFTRDKFSRCYEYHSGNEISYSCRGKETVPISGDQIDCEDEAIRKSIRYSETEATEQVHKSEVSVLPHTFAETSMDLFCTSLTGRSDSMCCEPASHEGVHSFCQVSGAPFLDIQADCSNARINRYSESFVIEATSLNAQDCLRGTRIPENFIDLLKMRSAFYLGLSSCKADATVLVLEQLIRMYLTIPTFAQRYPMSRFEREPTQDEITKLFSGLETQTTETRLEISPKFYFEDPSGLKDASGTPNPPDAEDYEKLRNLARAVIEPPGSSKTGNYAEVLRFLAVKLSGPRVPVIFLN